MADEEGFPVYDSMDDILNDMKKELTLKSSTDEFDNNDDPSMADEEEFPVYDSMADILNDMKKELSLKTSNDDNDPSMDAIMKELEFITDKPSSVFDKDTQQRYHIKEHIGNSSPSPVIFVFTTTTTITAPPPDSDYELVFSIKLANAVDPKYQSYFLKLLEETDLSSMVVPEHKNVLGIVKQFVDQDFFCVVFPSMGHGSLRGITASYFSDGLPEECVVIALKEILEGLAFVHEKGLVHKEINAGHVYMDLSGGIKIGFSATVYDDNRVLDQTSTSNSGLSTLSICNWAAAPEVYVDVLKKRDDLCSVKSDVWSIGITALELAYGSRFPILSRSSLEIVLRRMREKKRLFQQKQGKSHYDEKQKKPKKKKVFSEAFQAMVIRCLAVEPDARPTAVELLESDLFEESVGVHYFRQLVRENMNKIRPDEVGGFV